MKKFVRTPWVQSTLAWLASSYLAFTLATMRWRFENQVPIDAIVESPEGGIACFWHGQIALAVACRKVLKTKPRKVIISVSPDGEFIAKAVERLGFPAIRGSATLDKRMPRRSVEASMEAVRFIDDGGCVVITPDGPRGPAQHMPSGPPNLAKVRGSKVVVFGLAAKPTLTLKTWDRSQIPLPFGRGCVVFDGPFQIERGASPDAVEAARAEWENRLNAAQARAEALVAA